MVVHTDLLMLTFRVWVLEIALSGFNYLVLMRRVYEPRVGELRAHRIGMLTRIAYIFPFAYLLLAWADVDSVLDFLFAGTYWLLMVLAFEWIGRGLACREGLHVAVCSADVLPLAADRRGAAQPGRMMTVAAAVSRAERAPISRPSGREPATSAKRMAFAADGPTMGARIDMRASTVA